MKPGRPESQRVLPVRIELTTSPFITLALSRPPAMRGVCALDHPFAMGSYEPLGRAGKVTKGVLYH
jgi:hypothetical protein